MEVNKLWENNSINKYYIISLDKETNEWKFFKSIVENEDGESVVYWKNEPSRYGMIKPKAIEILNTIKSLENKKPVPSENEGNPTSENENPTPTPTPTEGEGESNGENENENGETPSEGEGGTDPSPTPTEPSTEEPEVPTEETQYKIITISSVTYNSEEVVIFDDDDYHKLITTLAYIDKTYPNDDVHVVVMEENEGKATFYFYLGDASAWFLMLRTNINYSIVSNITSLDDIRELL